MPITTSTREIGSPQTAPGDGAEILARLAEQTHLQEGAEGVRTVLRAIAAITPATTQAIARACRLPVPVVAALRREMERAGLLRRGHGMELTEAGRALADGLGLGAAWEATCATCEGRRVVVSRERRSLATQLQRAQRRMPPVNLALDQAHSLPEASMRRALYMAETGALDGRSILCLGDDDCISLALALLGRTRSATGSLPTPMEGGGGALSAAQRTAPGAGPRGGRGCDGAKQQEMPCRPVAHSHPLPAVVFAPAGNDPVRRVPRLVVVDCDTRLLEWLEETAAQHGLALECVAHDLRDPLPAALRGAFDVFETDPPYTLAGLRLFLSRAVEALRPSSGTMGFLSFAHRPPEEQREIARTLLAAGFAIDEIIPNFNQYVGAGILGNRGQIVRVTSASNLTPPIRGRYDGPLYTAQTWAHRGRGKDSHHGGTEGTEEYTEKSVERRLSRSVRPPCTSPCPPCLRGEKSLLSERPQREGGAA